ncbi:MAG: hypothetical protein JW774_10320 [Candidatus Aureabacteria bacterium]|nr:hypothetical protein [Candidatus Auribacterota bacterium]
MKRLQPSLSKRLKNYNTVKFQLGCILEDIFIMESATQQANNFNKNRFGLNLLVSALLKAGLIYLLVELMITVLQPLRTDDTFWHLKIGEILCQQKQFPAVSPLLFTSGTTKPVYHEWLFQVILFQVYAFFGWTGLKIFHAILCISILAALFSFMKTVTRNGFILLSGLILFILFSYQRLIQLRPELFSMLLFFLLYKRLIQLPCFSFKQALFFFCMTVFWANLHSLGPLILLFHLGFILAGIIFKKILKLLPALDLLSQIKAFLVMMMGFCVNPLGVRFYTFYFTGNAINPYSKVIDEWGHMNPFGLHDFLPLSSPLLVWGFVCLAGLTLFSCIAVRLTLLKIIRKIIPFPNQETILPLFHDAYFSACGIVALALMGYAVRFFWLIPLPWLGMAPYFKSRIKMPPLFSFLLSLILVLSGFIHFHLEGTKIYRIPLDVPGMWKAYFSWPYDQIKYHDRSVRFLIHIHAKGNICNPYHLGGFLAFHLYPQCSMFIDGRFEHYTEKVNKDHYELMHPGESFSRLINRYPIDYFFLPVEEEYADLIRKLNQLQWTILFQDHHTIIFQRP